MKIRANKFGEIEVDGENYDHDVVIYPKKIEERKKWISKSKHGTSHKFTAEEMEEYLKMGNSEKIEMIIFGTGYYGKLGPLGETKEILKKKNISFIEEETPKAAEVFEKKRETKDGIIGIFHVTC